MTQSEINVFIARQFDDGSGIFGTIVTATELILGSEYLSEQIKQIQGDDNTPPALKKTAQAVKNAEKRYKLLTAMFADKISGDANRIDPIFAREFNRGRVMNLSEGVSNSFRSINSISELMVQAEQSLKTIGPDDFPGSVEVTGSTGGSEGFVPPRPDVVDPIPPSFEQYQIEIQTQATSAFFEQVAPDFQSLINNFGVPVTINPDLSLTFGSGGDLSTIIADAVSSVGTTIADAVSSVFSNWNTVIAGVVAGAALNIGGIVGGALAALAYGVVPRMLAEIEDRIAGDFVL